MTAVDGQRGDRRPVRGRGRPVRGDDRSPGPSPSTSGVYPRPAGRPRDHHPTSVLISTASGRAAARPLRSVPAGRFIRPRVSPIERSTVRRCPGDRRSGHGYRGVPPAVCPPGDDARVGRTRVGGGRRFRGRRGAPLEAGEVHAHDRSQRSVSMSSGASSTLTRNVTIHSRCPGDGRVAYGDRSIRLGGQSPPVLAVSGVGVPATGLAPLPPARGSSDADTLPAGRHGPSRPFRAARPPTDGYGGGRVASVLRTKVQNAIGPALRVAVTVDPAALSRGRPRRHRPPCGAGPGRGTRSLGCDTL